MLSRWPRLPPLRSRCARFPVHRRNLTTTTTIITIIIITKPSDLRDVARQMAPSTGAIFLCGVANSLTISRRGRPTTPQLWKAGAVRVAACSGKLAVRLTRCCWRKSQTAAVGQPTPSAARGASLRFYVSGASLAPVFSDRGARIAQTRRAPWPKHRQPYP